mgnify:FL=1|tara:strand:- start:61 stop:369 length:309 start_codon:yes stop_codon:yes gene_type:complete
MIGHKQLVERQRSIESFRDKISRLEKENKALNDKLDQANRLRWFCEDKVGRLIKENKKLNVENGELQLAIARFQDMEAKIELAILNREGNIETGRDLKIVER